mmetsp:Transcript_7221/g.18780  ORF Transcript_7221/g.18780 Transcript_7221/m.18780 type:complete len:366 (-) Transcript_7221:1987-3084(-)
MLVGALEEPLDQVPAHGRRARAGLDEERRALDVGARIHDDAVVVRGVVRRPNIKVVVQGRPRGLGVEHAGEDGALLLAARVRVRVLRVPRSAVVRRLHALARDELTVVAGLQARAVVLAVAPVVRGIKSHGHERLAVRGRAGRPAVVRRRKRKILHELVEWRRTRHSNITVVRPAGDALDEARDGPFRARRHDVRRHDRVGLGLARRADAHDEDLVGAPQPYKVLHARLAIFHDLVADLQRRGHVQDLARKQSIRDLELVVVVELRGVRIDVLHVIEPLAAVLAYTFTVEVRVREDRARVGLLLLQRRLEAYTRVRVEAAELSIDRRHHRVHRREVVVVDLLGPDVHRRRVHVARVVRHVVQLVI